MNQYEKKNYSIILTITLILTFLNIFIISLPSRALGFYDSFDSEFIDSTKWEESDHSVREINNGKLQMNEYGTTRRFSTYLHLTTPVTGYLEAKITVENGSLVFGDGTGYARIAGYFYNSEHGPGNYNEYEGDVWCQLYLSLENDNTLTAKVGLWKSTTPDHSTWETILEQEFAKNINHDTEYTVSMELSGSQFIFRCDDEEIIYQIQTPVYTPYAPAQLLGTRIFPEEGSAVSVKALFDDVSVVKNVLYDSFDSEFIDLTKWEESDHSVREINNGKLRMNEYGTTSPFSTSLELTAPVTGYLEAKITVENGSLVFGDGTGFARIGGFFYNSEYGPDNYNASEGDVWSDVKIVLENDDTLTAKASISESTTPDRSTWETILDQEFAISINHDTEYTLSMELSGSQLIFRCDDEEIIYQIQTPVYTPYLSYQSLTTRIYPEDGSAVSVKALFDDVKLYKYLDIKANASDGPVTIAPGDALSVKIDLDSGDLLGENADWWVLAQLPSGKWFNYNLALGWQPGLSYVHQGGLFDVSSLEVLNFSNLAEGTYTFYFAVDMVMDGVITMDDIYYDSVEVNVRPN